MTVATKCGRISQKDSLQGASSALVPKGDPEMQKLPGVGRILNGWRTDPPYAQKKLFTQLGNRLVKLKFSLGEDALYFTIPIIYRAV